MLEVFINILESKGLSNIIQIVIASMALIIFFLKNKREKETIAKIVIIEIRYSEKRIREIKENDITIDAKPIIYKNSWEKNKHLFARNLDTDEFILIDNFYHKITRIEAARKQELEIYNESILEKAKIIQLKLIENITKDINKKDFREHLIDETNKEAYIFHSNEPNRIIKLEIRNFEFVTTSTAGDKIKKIAKIT